ncbi:MAG: flagellar hook-basal body complex protein FliE [Calditrichaeota bacterium]|nr:MAG: flagellar hook-basal body complex protein FliE [Calditrichota bacterium]MBL1204001.1 flagellar hook-basal body complex protein FliE [Calditrichota bacterium]NOG43832.1 flagellar hook-basal body complex protein FliE [Calditrichota bacterium]
MSSIDQLASVDLHNLIRATNNQQSENISEADKKDFGDTITDFIKSVNQKSKEAGQLATDVVQGKSQNLHEAMAAMEESGLSFKLMLEIRNKLLESFKEVQRMQV